MKVKATYEKQVHQIEYQTGQSLLEACLTAKIAAPYSCMEGHCGACEAKLTLGKVMQSDQLVQAGQVIRTCMSKVVGEVCEFDYDSN